MKISASKVLALGGLCALLVGAGNTAFAQGYDHQDRNYDSGQYRQNDRHHDQDQNNQNWRHGQGQYHYGQYNQAQNDGWTRDNQYRQSAQYRHANGNERRRLDRLHAAYAHAAANGNYNAAERDHQHAQAIRARLRDQHRDGDQGRRDTN